MFVSVAPLSAERQLFGAPVSGASLVRPNARRAPRQRFQVHANAEEFKRQLREAVKDTSTGRVVGEAQRTKILDLVGQLEGSNATQNPASSPLLDGCWRLLFTTRPGTASPIQRLVVGRVPNVHQLVKLQDPADRRIRNIADLGPLNGKLTVEAAATIDPNGTRVKFAFDRAAFRFRALPVRVPYPVPFRLLGDEAKGWLDVTYLDADFRISRGNKGTIFLLQRANEADIGVPGVDYDA